MGKRLQHATLKRYILVNADNESHAIELARPVPPAELPLLDAGMHREDVEPSRVKEEARFTTDLDEARKFHPLIRISMLS